MYTYIHTYTHPAEDLLRSSLNSVDGKGYGKGNMGVRGIKAFLNNHRCNAICQALGLPVTGTDPQPCTLHPAP